MIEETDEEGDQTITYGDSNATIEHVDSIILC